MEGRESRKSKAARHIAQEVYARKASLRFAPSRESQNAALKRVDNNQHQRHAERGRSQGEPRKFDGSPETEKEQQSQHKEPNKHR